MIPVEKVSRAQSFPKAFRGRKHGFKILNSYGRCEREGRPNIVCYVSGPSRPRQRNVTSNGLSLEAFAFVT